MALCARYSPSGEIGGVYRRLVAEGNISNFERSEKYIELPQGNISSCEATYRRKGMIMIIREMSLSDWCSVSQIYNKGISSGKCTFRTDVPTIDEFYRGIHDFCRYVAVCDNAVVGFVAISPVSSKHHYSGVAEVMIYIDEKYQRNGIGTALLNKLIDTANSNGIWCLYSSIFSSNEKSIGLHTKCGFRMIGYRERIAKDKFGNWTDTVLMEYRFKDYSY